MSLAKLWQSIRPQSLFARLFAMLLIVMLVALVCLMLLFRQDREQSIRQQVSDEKIAQLKQLQSTLQDLPAAEFNGPNVRRIGLQSGFFLVPFDRRPEIGRVPANPRLQDIASRVKAELGKDTDVRVGMRQDEPVLWVKIVVNDMALWAGMRVRPPPPDLPHRLLLLSLALLTVLLLATAYFGHRLVKPLRALAQAIETMGSGQKPPRLAESGAAELAAVAKGFNQLSDTLTRLELDRAEMLAGVSHDMRTPLARLRLQLEFAHLSVADKRAFEIELEEIEANVGQFLDFAQVAHLEANAQQRLEKSPIEIDGLLADLQQLETHRGRSINLQLNPVPALMGNLALLRRALLNLLENAHRYSEGKPITLSCERRAGQLVLQVIDQGPGIEPDRIAYLKQAFTRGNSARGGASGVGLGLAIVERIARLHSAEFDLSNRRDGQTGTVATLYFPP
jgi:two-component system, OmpR family, osmolarity sensor histidine kinase EnvZ